MKKFIKEKGSLGLFLLSLLFLIAFQLKTLYGGDSGDYLSAAGTWGIPHPPGYPLYTLLAGILHNFFSFANPVIRVGLLSVVPGALTVFFVYKILNFFIDRKFSLLSSLMLLFLYPFWLYSEAVEVFSLANLFLVGLTYLLILITKRKHYSLLKWFFFLFGLSLTHHHTILFFVPGVIYLFKKYRLFKKLKWRHLIYLLVGFLPYLYAPVAASMNPPINWENPVNLNNFIDMVTRAEYGTFQAARQIENSLMGRFFALLGFLNFFISDFSIIGFLLVGVGTFVVLKKKTFAKYFAINLVSFIFLIIYASFPLVSDFQVGTFERFLIAPYILAVFLLGFGVQFLYKSLEKLDLNKQKLVQSIFYLVLFILLPVSRLIINYPKVSILRNDFTAEKWTKDLLDTVEKDAVLIGRSDTAFFNLSYLYYSLGYRKDEVKFFSPFHIRMDYYQQYIREEFPNLDLKELEEDEDELYTWTDFVVNNYDNFPIYTIPENRIEGFVQVPTGLVYRYYKEGNVPPVDELIDKNNQLWQDYNDPLSGSLGEFKNLFLAHLLEYYENAAKAWSEYLLSQDQPEEAAKYLEKSLHYEEQKDKDYYLLQGRVHLKKKDCQKAEQLFKNLKKVYPEDPYPDAYLRQVYLECYEDPAKAEEFLDSCLDKESKQRIPLEE